MGFPLILSGLRNQSLSFTRSCVHGRERGRVQDMAKKGKNVFSRINQTAIAKKMMDVTNEDV